MTAAVSRLHWDDGSIPRPHHEIPHVRGVPIRVGVPVDTEVHRFVPNRLGIAEDGDNHDIVHTMPGLDQHVGRFRKLLRRLAQIPGVQPAVDPAMACTILLTPGVTRESLERVNARFPGSVASAPARLSEFPGGIQIVAGGSVGPFFGEFADALEACIAGGWQ